MITIGILLFNEVEVLDFAGPFEVFSLAKQGDQKPFKVVTIADNQDYISARNGLRVIPEYHFENCPPL
ncbi:MAG: DJ-1/PfpI family protein, partial [Bacteroidota bacterium]